MRKHIGVILAVLLVAGFASAEKTKPSYMASTGTHVDAIGYGGFYGTEFVASSKSFVFGTLATMTSVGSGTDSYIRGIRFHCLGLSTTGTGKVAVKAGAGTNGSSARAIQGDAMVATNGVPYQNNNLDLGSATSATLYVEVSDPNCRCFLEVWRR